MRPILTLAAALALPASMALAASTETETAPTTTETTTECEKGTVWDADSQSCVDVKSELLDDDTLYAAARELAYAGRTDDAQAALAQMSDQTEDRVMTYWGFTHRKQGDMGLAMDFYQRALERNPDNLLARSYMGMGLVEQGKVELAQLQLDEIRARGGAGSWPEKALRVTIETGASYTY